MGIWMWWKSLGSRCLGWCRRLDAIHDRKGYIDLIDLGPLPIWLCRLIFWAETRFGNIRYYSVLYTRYDCSPVGLAAGRRFRNTTHFYVSECYTMDVELLRSKLFRRGYETLSTGVTQEIP